MISRKKQNSGFYNRGSERKHMEQRQYWNEVSATKEFTIPIDFDRFSLYVRPKARIVDVGCGYGRVLNDLNQLGFQNLTGFDFSEGMIRRGRTQFPALDLREMTAGRIPLPDQSADAVILFAVLTCIYRDAEQKTLIDEIRRVLRPGGVLYISDYLIGEDERNIRRYEQFAPVFGTYGVFEPPEGAVCRHHTEAYIESLLKEFETLEFFPTVYTTMNGHKAKGFSYFGIKPEEKESEL